MVIMAVPASTNGKEELYLIDDDGEHYGPYPSIEDAMAWVNTLDDIACGEVWEFEVVKAVGVIKLVAPQLKHTAEYEEKK